MRLGQYQVSKPFAHPDRSIRYAHQERPSSVFVGDDRPFRSVTAPRNQEDAGVLRQRIMYSRLQQCTVTQYSLVIIFQ